MILLVLKSTNLLNCLRRNKKKIVDEEENTKRKESIDMMMSMQVELLNIVRTMSEENSKSESDTNQDGSHLHSVPHVSGVRVCCESRPSRSRSPARSHTPSNISHVADWVSSTA